MSGHHFWENNSQILRRPITRRPQLSCCWVNWREYWKYDSTQCTKGEGHFETYEV